MLLHTSQFGLPNRPHVRPTLLSRQPRKAAYSTRVRCLPEHSKQKPDEPRKEDPKTLANAFSTSLTEVAKAMGRVSNSTNLLLINDESEENWRLLDSKVNKYPGQRDFTAIGTGGDSFKSAMIEAVASVVGNVHCECVAEKARGRYISVTVGPVWVENADQVIQIYNNMKEDARLKWYL